MRKEIISILLVLGVVASLVVALPVGADSPRSLQRVVITPNTAELFIGGTQQFTAQGYDTYNSPISNLTYTWVELAGSGTISKMGGNTCLFTAGNEPGRFSKAVLVAARQGNRVKIAYATVRIIGPLEHVVIKPSQATLKAGGTKQFRAQGYDANNAEIPNLTYYWSVVAGNGTINSTGLFTADTVGGTSTVSVTATQNGAISQTAYASVTVDPPGVLRRVVITPSTAKLLAGGTQQFTAQGYDAYDAPISDLTFTWVELADCGTISSIGVFTAGNEPGKFSKAVLVVARQGNRAKAAYATVRITGSLDHVVIKPSQATLKAGGTKQFRAQGYDANNIAIPNLMYSWSVDGGGTISNTGRFKADNVGGVSIVSVTAIQGAITQTAYASVTVDPPGILRRVVITPSTPKLRAGATQQFTAQGYDAYNVPIPNLTYTWVELAGSGTISNTGGNTCLFTVGNDLGKFRKAVLVTARQGNRVKIAYATVRILGPSSRSQENNNENNWFGNQNNHDDDD